MAMTMSSRGKSPYKPLLDNKRGVKMEIFVDSIAFSEPNNHKQNQQHQQQQTSNSKETTNLVTDNNPSQCDNLSNFQTIKGRLRVEILNESIQFDAMNIQLLGYFTFRNSNALDEPIPTPDWCDPVMPCRGEQFLPDPKTITKSKLNRSKATPASRYTDEPPYIFHVMKLYDDQSSKVLKKQLYYFPFELELNKTPFPASLLRPDAKIVYKLIACFKILAVETTAAEKMVTLCGHLELPPSVRCYKNPSGGSAIKIRGEHEPPSSTPRVSISRLRQMKLTLQLSRLDFARDEPVDFCIILDNPTGEFVKELQISLIGVMRRFDGMRVEEFDIWKSTRRDVNLPYTRSLRNRPKLYKWLDEIPLPNTICPTFTVSSSSRQMWRKNMIEIRYFVQFFAIVPYGGVIKGEREIKVGTTRPRYKGQRSSDSAARRADSQSNDLRQTISQRRCSTSTVAPVNTLPPSYSTVWTRRPSLETLPPGYDDAWDQEQGNFNPDMSNF